MRSASFARSRQPVHRATVTFQVAIQTSQSASAWRAVGIVVGVCLTLLLVAYHDTVSSILETWSRDPLGHGFFVLPVAAYLVWSRRRHIASANPRASVVALPVLAMLSFLWLLGHLTATVSVQQSCFVAMVIVVTWVVVGSAAARAMAFPLGLLVFAMPIGDRVAPFLQTVTGSWTTHLLVFSGVPAALEGQVIDVAGTRWRVSEACGGVNYVVAAVAVAYAYAGTVYRTWSHRGALVAAGLFVSFVGNTIRVYTTILLDHAGATRVAAGMGHEMYGVFVFAIMIAAVFLICGRWSEKRLSSDGSTRTRQTHRPVPAASTSRTVACATTAMLLVVGGPVAARLLVARAQAASTTRAESPVVSAPWQAADDTLSTWSPRFVNPRGEFRRTYQAENDVVTLYVAFYDSLQPGTNVTSAANTLYRAPWSSTHERLRSITVRARPFQVKETLLQNGSTYLVVWNWYEVDGRMVLTVTERNCSSRERDCC